MVSIAEIEKLALALSDSDRAILASHLLGSLPPILDEDDEGIAEALRREAEIDGNPDAWMTLEQLNESVSRRRR